jgi:hypothetical protein
MVKIVVSSIDFDTKSTKRLSMMMNVVGLLKVTDVGIRIKRIVCARTRRETKTLISHGHCGQTRSCYSATNGAIKVAD